jgi:rsbT co-antagonist protein RsbR
MMQAMAQAGAHGGETVTAAEWERRKQFVRFTEEDARLLRELHPITAAMADEVMEELYRHLLQFEETKAFFPDEPAIARVKAMQKTYFLGLTQGEYGAAYLADRLNIGRVHQRIGLSPQWHMGTYSLYWQLVLPRVMKASQADIGRLPRLLLALIKIMKLDEELAVTAYFAATIVPH